MSAKPSTPEKVLLATILMVPILIVIAIVLNGMRGKEVTPKWQKEPPAASETR